MEHQLSMKYSKSGLFWVSFFLFTVQVSFGEIIFYAPFDGTADPEKLVTGGFRFNKKGVDTKFVEGVKGKAVVVGKETYIAYPVTGNLPINQGSISLLVKPMGWNGADALYHFLVCAQTETDGWLLLYKIPEKKTSFLGGTKTNYSFAAADSNSWKDGEWQHFCAVWDKGDATIYVNGSLAGHAKWPLIPESIGKEFLVGGWLWGKCEGDQAIDELTIYDKPLTEKEVVDCFEKYKAALEKANSALSQSEKKENSSDKGGADHPPKS